MGPGQFIRDDAPGELPRVSAVGLAIILSVAGPPVRMKRKVVLIIGMMMRSAGDHTTNGSTAKLLR